MKPKFNKRLLSLDVLRGITIAGMILVNNPGSWGYMYAPLKHAEWNGLTPKDLIFPFFMFIMGISTYISLNKFNFDSSPQALYKICKRTFLIFLIGYALAWFGTSFSTFYKLENEDMSILHRIGLSISNFEHIRIMGVLQRLGLTYGIVSLVAIYVKHRYIPLIIIIGLIAYFITLLVGNGFIQGDSNILAIVDQKILGLDRMWVDSGLDPEGILSTIPAACHVLIGFLFGRILVNQKDIYEKMQYLLLYGAILTFIGFLFSYACPINKKIWSPSFVLATCGLAASLLGILVWIIDIKQYKKWSVFFESFGVNPLFIFVLSGILSRFLTGIFITTSDGRTTIKGIIYDGLVYVGVNQYLASLLFALLFITISWSIAHVLYKKKIYIKL